MRPWTPLVLLVLVGRLAAAHPKPPPHLYVAEDDLPETEDVTDWRASPARFEWSTWLGFGFGVASERVPVTSLARASSPAITVEHRTAWIFSAGAELTVPLAHHMRLGPWIGLHDLEPMAGAELQLTHAPAQLDLFLYPGEGVWTLRAGGGPDHAKAALAWGYRCPWKLWGPYDHTSRYEIGPRITLAVTRTYRDPADWSATIGLEVEPVGALRYLLGIKSWYR